MIKHKRDFIQLIGTITVFSIILSLIVHVVRTPEYWDRGQPPRIKTLYQRANDQLTANLERRSEQRSDIADQASSVRASLEMANNYLAQANYTAAKSSLEEVRNALVALESNLSIGSRAPYGELTGQLRSIIKQIDAGEKTESSAILLFSTRVISFLGRELIVASPVKNGN